MTSPSRYAAQLENRNGRILCCHDDGTTSPGPDSFAQAWLRDFAAANII